MKVFNLACRQDHRFEGWFASSDAFDDQQARQLIECPVCASHEVRKMPAAPRLNLSHHGAESSRASREAAIQARAITEQAAEAKASTRASGQAAPPADPAQKENLERAQALYMMIARRLVESTEDVGSQFAEEARRIHYNEAPERAIRGQATPDEAEALRDEGIEVFSMPLPAGLKEPLQ